MKLSLLSALFFLSTPVWAAPAPRALPAETQAEIEALLRHPGIQSGHVGIAVVALGEARSPTQFPATHYDGYAQPLLFGHEEAKRFLPASNQKLFTAAWVLKQLGGERTFATRAVATKILALRAGAWPSSVPYPSVITLYGDGDPSLSTEGLHRLAEKVAESEKNAIIVRTSDSLWPKGSMNGEEGGGRYPDGWTLDDALWYYGPPVSSLAINRNQVDVTITAGANVGDPATVKTEPEAPFSIFAPVTTVAAGDPRAGTLQWTRGDKESPLSSTLTIEGALGVGKSDSEGVAVPNPQAWTQGLFANELRATGAQVVEPEGFYGQKEPRVVAELPSPPVKVLLQRFLKSSDNLYGEMLLRRAGAELPPTNEKLASVASTGLAARAHIEMMKWLRSSGVPTASLRFSDGSGLSRYNQMTPIAMARLLGAVEKINDGSAFYDALPVAGVDGTLKNRMKASSAQNNVRAKTGTFSIANCLSGYVTSKDGQRLAVSILTNGVENGELARNWEGRVFATLANADFSKK